MEKITLADARRIARQISEETDAALQAERHAETACPHALGDTDPQTGQIVCTACGADVREAAVPEEAG